MDMKRLVQVAWFTPTLNGWGLPIALIASPGMSKTAQLRQLAAECGLPCEILSPGERGEGAFGVVPVPDHGVLTYPAPEWVNKFQPNADSEDKTPRGVVFVDELTTAPPALQPPLLGLFLEKRIGGYQLPPGVRCVAAYNKVEEAAAGYDLPPPLANRMGHVPFDAGGVEEWTDWLVGVNGIGIHANRRVNSTEEERRVLEVWTESFARAKGKIVAFLRRRPEFLHKMPQPHDPSASGAWPSRRTWEFATRALASCEIHGVDEDIETMLLSSFVGDAVVGELYTYLKDEDLPDPADILDEKIKFAHDERRLDRSFAILASMTALVVPDAANEEKGKIRDRRAKKLWTIITEIAEKGSKDVVFGAAQRMAKSGHLRHIEARPALALLQKVMEAAGIGGR